MDGRSDRSLGKRFTRMPRELALDRCTAQPFKTKLNTLTLCILVNLAAGELIYDLVGTNLGRNTVKMSLARA